MSNTQSANGVPCGICKAFIPEVEAKSSALMTALNYPDRWDDDLEVLVCDDCRTQARGAKAWLKHGGLRECIKTGRNAQ